MQRDRDLASEIARFQATAPIETAATPPASWYTWQSFLDLEKETVFQNRWLFVGHEAQLQEPGDYFTGSFLGWPYLVVRDDRGSLQAFYNVCFSPECSIDKVNEDHLY